LHKAESSSQAIFCLFVDGLDEYHGNHLELIALLKDLACNPNIKLCVSSRPWNPFRNTFGVDTPQLRLEDHSYDNIAYYTHDRIHEGLALCPITQSWEDDDQSPALIQEIVTRANGVFLWVVLVVQSVIRGLAEGDPIFMLRHRVQVFPVGLEEFFRCILTRVEAVYKAQTCQALKLAFPCGEEDGEMRDLSTFIDF
jgi:hypothetical protein